VTAGARRVVEFALPIGVTDEEGRVHRNGLLRKMTGRDEAILTDRQNQKNGGKLVTELLASCIVELGELKSVPQQLVADMYSADRNYLLVRLRVITFGPELSASYKCPSCGFGWETTEDLDALPVTQAEGPEAAEQVTVELVDGYLDQHDAIHTAVVLRLPTGADESAVAPQMRRNPTHGKNALLARCLKSLGDLPEHRLRALGPKILADLTMGDRRLIDRALNSAAPGIDLIRPLECPSCGHEFRQSLDMSNFLALD
jgi:hypothetical protein